MKALAHASFLRTSLGIELQHSLSHSLNIGEELGGGCLVCYDPLFFFPDLRLHHMHGEAAEATA